MASIETEQLSYSGGGIEMNGYLAWDSDIDGPRPGVIVVHEWWGQNDYPRSRADQLAALGYTAMAIDLYGDGVVASNPEEAGALMTGLVEDMEGCRARFQAAMDVLKAHATVNEEQIAAIGFCLGGGVVLHMARMGLDLEAVASFHGSLGLAIAPGVERMATRVVAYNGEADVLVPTEQVTNFLDEMEDAHADYQLVQLPGALHGFSNPAATARGEKYGLPLAYSELADRCSWDHMRLLLEDVFRG